MRSATDFLPRVINTLMNLASSWLLYFGSGSVSRFGTSLRRGISSQSFRIFSRTSLGGFRLLGAVLGTALLAILHALGIQAAAHHVVTHAGQILDAAATDQHDRVFLQIVAFTADVADDFKTVGQADFGNLAQCRIRLLRRGGIHTGAHATFLRRPRQ